MKFIIVCTVFILSCLWNFPSFAMKHEYDREIRVTNGLICEGCLDTFAKAESRVEHIIAIHYACPWCCDLEYLDPVAWKKLSQKDQEIRINHIKACAEKKNTSLWQCKKCSAIFHYLKVYHQCGLKHQVNLITNKVPDSNKILKTEQEHTCNTCQRAFTAPYVCKNHMIRVHGLCPWCHIQFASELGIYKKLSLEERKSAHAHVVECAQANNESLFACDTCYGVMLCGRNSVHAAISCNGEVYQASEKIKRNGYIIEQGIKEETLLNQSSDQHSGENVLSSATSELLYTINVPTGNQCQIDLVEEENFIAEILEFCNKNDDFFTCLF